MKVQFSLMSRANSRRTQYTKADTLRAIKELGLTVIVDHGIVIETEKEVHSEQEAKDTRKTVEQRLLLIHRNYAWIFKYTP